MTGQWWIVPAAVGLDLLIGDPRWLPHPVVLIGRLIGWQERLLRRLVKNELVGGVLLLICTVGITLAAGWLFLTLARLIHPWLGVAASLYLSFACLAARSLHGESAKVAAALGRDDMTEARQALSMIVGRDTEHLSEPEIWRGAVETVAENSSDGVIAPLLFLMLAGPLGALCYKAVNTLDSMVGYKNERYLLFGRASARFDDLLNLIPARLTGLLLCCAAPFVGLSGGRGLSIMLRDGSNHSSPNSGISEAAAAGALGVRLGGINRYFGREVEKPTIGEPLKPLDHRAWGGAVRLMYGSELLLTAGYVAIKVWE